MKPICFEHHKPAAMCKCGGAAAPLTHSVSIHEMLPRWPLGTGTYLSGSSSSWGASSLDVAEREAAEYIARAESLDAERRPLRKVERVAIITLACRRCFAGNDPFPINWTGDPEMNRRIREERRASEACPACHGTLQESPYAPEWPEEMALSLVPEIRARLDQADAEREAYLAAQRTVNESA